MLELKNISAAYVRDNLILEDVSFKLEQGRKHAVLGRNGAGKSTLVKRIMGLVPYSQGEVYFRGLQLDGLPVHRMIRLGIGYFHQGGQIFPQMTVYENLRFARFKTPSGRGLDINVMRDYFPFLRDQRTHGMQAGDLSGGERTQLALAMVLVSEPELLILDEPFAGVSPKNTGAIIDYLNASYERKPYSLLLIEQNQYLAQRLCDGISVLKQKEIFPFLEK